ncbi:glucan 1,3-beta-glucosidase [Neoconidiobolus thromboides FSU 785]|nr:glucan 1,3-beta-glucosidase [Neoconidiobolus thromboides FSU 785]
MKLFLITFYSLFNIVKSFNYGVDKIRGVNLGGWLVLEPWINPSLFRQFEGQPNGAVDEWEFCQKLGANEAKRQLIQHWDTWVTENDISKLARSGINHIRIPIGYWAFDISGGEPYVQGQLPYLTKAINWARQYNLKVIIDIHGAPGSQNGFDNSGKRGDIGFFNKDENITRMLNIIKYLTDNYVGNEYESVVAAIELVNEPAGWSLDMAKLQKFYLDGHNIIRNKSKSVLVNVHDAFKPLNQWTYLRDDPQYSNVLLDTHYYQVFEYGLVSMSKDQHLRLPCARYGDIAQSNQKLWTIVGEWSLASTDCTKWLNGFNRGARYDGTLDAGKGPACPGCTCRDKDELATYSPEHRQFLKNFAMQQIAVYEQAGSGWFFWNFKAEKSPEWDFLMAVDQGWIDLHQPVKHTC